MYQRVDKFLWRPIYMQIADGKFMQTNKIILNKTGLTKLTANILVGY